MKYEMADNQEGFKISISGKVRIDVSNSNSSIIPIQSVKYIQGQHFHIIVPGEQGCQLQVKHFTTYKQQNSSLWRQVRSIPEGRYNKLEELYKYKKDHKDTEEARWEDPWKISITM